MNHRWLLSLTFAISLGCSPAADNATPGSGGSKAGGAGGAKTGGAGGSPGSGGNVSTGGTPGSGGSVSTGGTPGSGGAGGAKADGAAGGSGGAKADGGPVGEVGGGAMGALDNYVITVPCPPGSMGGSCNVAANVRAFDKPLTFGGNPATTYKVTVKMCGLFETRPYTMCKSTMNPRHCVDGVPGTGGFAATYPTLAMKVGAPAATHYLNGMYQADTIVRIEYTATFDIQGGTTLNFISDGGSNGGIYTQRMKPNFAPCEGVPGVMQPYAGQFFHFKVMSVVPPL